MRRITVKFKKLDKSAKSPMKAHDGNYADAGWDLFALESTTLKSGEIKLLRTGIAIELPEGDFNYFYEAQLRSRSGHRKKGLLVPVGTIDAGYRGDVGCILYNLSGKDYTVESGEKICQLVVVQIPQVDIQESIQLSETKRGGKGFGSTGKK